MHIELQEHGQTLQLFQNAQAAEWEGLVAKHRLQLTAEFFGHVENLIHAAHQDEAQREGIMFVHRIAQQCLCCYMLLVHAGSHCQKSPSPSDCVLSATLLYLLSFLCVSLDCINGGMWLAKLKSATASCWSRSVLGASAIACSQAVLLRS